MPSEVGSGRDRVFSLRKVTLGDIATASFVLCVASGALLAASFDPAAAAHSIAGWLMLSPPAVFLRNVHYWTAMMFLVFTVLHVCDHLRRSTERDTGRGAWLRLTLGMPVVAFLLLSGFLLRGDTDAQQARRILDTVVTQIPLAGSFLATLFFGAGKGLQVLYVQHAATATIIVWLVILDHTRELWPRPAAITAAGLATGALSMFLSPGLHDGLSSAVKGPWYFLGLQEILHWIPWLGVLIGTGALALVLFWALPFLSPPMAVRVKTLLLAGMAAYVVLCGIGLFLRGDNWSLLPNWPHGPGDLHPGMIVGIMSLAADKIPDELPVVLGRNEGCLVCHNDVEGLGDAHRPESIGCASCHGGDVFTLNRDRAHAGMIAVPGNLANVSRTCGQAGCHETIVPRVMRSIMTTFAGVIAADRRVFGEPVYTSATPPHVHDLGTSAADTHLRQLCVSCHLGQEKSAWGPITEESRGGGCNACHLSYSAEAAEGLRRYQATAGKKRDGISQMHPTLSIAPDDGHCFGCHSRSGRISTNYEGWQELHEAPTTAQVADDDVEAPRFRRLDDGRLLMRVLPDIHQERGLACIDCHTAIEVMGSGRIVTRKRDQVRVTCQDCHAREIVSVPAGSVEPEARRILSLRKWMPAPSERVGVASAGGTLVNVRIDASGRARMLVKRTGEALDLRAPLPVCTGRPGHARLSCNSCHSAWAPRCETCHTSFDPAAEGFDHLTQTFTRGSWMESSGGFSALPPTLGVRTGPRDAGKPREVIDTFIPGMILTIDPDGRFGSVREPVRRRLYARTFAHTIRREVRSCESCHNDPVALGFGQGKLRFEVSGTTGRWRFTPENGPSSADGLPGDAWTGFLQTRVGMVSAWDDVRPFTAEEQRRILRVGACLTCHAGNSPVMRKSVASFETLVARRGKRCAVPAR